MLKNSTGLLRGLIGLGMAVDEARTGFDDLADALPLERVGGNYYRPRSARGKDKRKRKMAQKSKRRNRK